MLLGLGGGDSPEETKGLEKEEEREEALVG